MIITTVAHGRTSADSARLAAHLSKTNDQDVRLIEASGVLLSGDLSSEIEDVRRYMVLNKRGIVGFRHITINPAVTWTDSQIKIAVALLLKELSAEQCPWILMEHSKARANDKCPNHYHLVVGQFGPNGKSINTKNDFIRLEAIARIMEVDFGEALTIGRKSHAVTAVLERMGRKDVADCVLETSAKTSAPRSAMSTKSRARAEREGIGLPILRQAVEDAWRTEDPITALKEQGVCVSPGVKDGVWVVSTAAGGFVGALDRLVHGRRVEVTQRMDKLRLMHGLASQEDTSSSTEKRRNDDGNRTGNCTYDSSWTHTSERDPPNQQTRRRDAVDSGRNFENLRIERGGEHDRIVWAPRGENRYNIESHDDSGNARTVARRRARVIVEVRRAERARRRGTSFDAKAYKRQLWMALFGADLDDELLDHLTFIDAANKYLWTRRGWVRDGGDVISASSADPEVVAIMVAAAIAKGWHDVEIWGDAAFLLEARRQFEAVGIGVSIRGRPQEVGSPPTEQKSFQTRFPDLEQKIYVLEKKMEKLKMPIRETTAETETKQRLLMLRIRNAELTGDLINRKKLFMERRKSFFHKSWDSISGAYRKLKEEILSMEDEIIGVKKEIKLHKGRLEDLGRRKQLENESNIYEVSQKILELQGLMKRSTCLDFTLHDDSDRRAPMRP